MTISTPWVVDTVNRLVLAYREKHITRPNVLLVPSRHVEELRHEINDIIRYTSPALMVRGGLPPTIFGLVPVIVDASEFSVTFVAAAPPKPPPARPAASPEMIALHNAARHTFGNIAEFGTITDPEFVEGLQTALDRVLGTPAETPLEAAARAYREAYEFLKPVRDAYEAERLSSKNVATPALLAAEEAYMAAVNLRSEARFKLLCIARGEA